DRELPFDGCGPRLPIRETLPLGLDLGPCPARFHREELLLRFDLHGFGRVARFEPLPDQRARLLDRGKLGAQSVEFPLAQPASLGLLLQLPLPAVELLFPLDETLLLVPSDIEI